MSSLAIHDVVDNKIFFHSWLGWDRFSNNGDWDKWDESQRAHGPSNYNLEIHYKSEQLGLNDQFVVITKW